MLSICQQNKQNLGSGQFWISCHHFKKEKNHPSKKKKIKEQEDKLLPDACVSWFIQVGFVDHGFVQLNNRATRIFLMNGNQSFN